MSDLDPTSSLLAHMANNGFRPKAIQWDGKVHRFPGRDQRGGTNGWYVAFQDQRGAVYGDWREPEVRYHWKAHDTEELSREKVGAARQAARAQFEEDRRRREETSKKKHAAIAKVCQATWKNSEELVSGDFPYLIRKQFEDAPGARVAEKNGNRFLIVPMYDPVSRMIQSLQWIATDGTKKNHLGGRAKGCCGAIDEDAFTKDGNDTLYICEGWATAVTIHLATGCTVVIAFSAGNLKRIVVHYRTKYPDATIIVCADNDRYKANGKGKHNPGVTAARTAVRAAQKAVPGAKTHIAIPDFESLDGKPTDFDDLRTREGMEAVVRWLDPQQSGKAVTGEAPEPKPKPKRWAEPEPEPDAEPWPEPGTDPELEDVPADILFKIPGGKTWCGLLQALNMLKVEVRYNLRTGRDEWRSPDPGMTATLHGDIVRPNQWREFNSRSRAKLYNVMADRFVAGKKDSPFHLGEYRRTDFMNAILTSRQVDPFLTWLHDLPEWDGIARIDMVLTDCLGAESTELTRWASRYLFMGAVARTLKPGRKFDQVPVLAGPGGIGKSALLCEMLPDPDYFSDGLYLAAHPKVQVEATLGRVIVEIAEMAGVTRADQERLKAYVSRTDDGSVRLAYRRDAERMPRRFILTATADRHECLPGDPNLRRWVMVECRSGSNIEEFFAQPGHRQQLWAEALSRVQQGEDPRLPRHLMPAQTTLNEAHRGRDAIEDRLATSQRLQLAMAAAGDYGLTLLEIGDAIDLDITSRMAMRKRLGTALTSAGWVKAQVTRPDQGRAWRWTLRS